MVATTRATAGARDAPHGRGREQPPGTRGLRLLLLDTETDSPAQPFYVARGWRVVGVIEDYAATPYGEPAATTILELRRPRLTSAGVSRPGTCPAGVFWTIGPQTAVAPEWPGEDDER